MGVFEEKSVKDEVNQKDITSQNQEKNNNVLRTSISPGYNRYGNGRLIRTIIRKSRSPDYYKYEEGKLINSHYTNDEFTDYNRYDNGRLVKTIIRKSRSPDYY